MNLKSASQENLQQAIRTILNVGLEMRILTSDMTATDIERIDDWFHGKGELPEKEIRNLLKATFGWKGLSDLRHAIDNRTEQKASVAS